MSILDRILAIDPDNHAWNARNYARDCIFLLVAEKFADRSFYARGNAFFDVCLSIRKFGQKIISVLGIPCHVMLETYEF